MHNRPKFIRKNFKKKNPPRLTKLKILQPKLSIDNSVIPTMLRIGEAVPGFLPVLTSQPQVPPPAVQGTDRKRPPRQKETERGPSGRPS